jgi:hypothetical protein
MVLIKVYSGRLAGGPDDDNAIGAFADVPVDQFPKCIEIEASILMHRRNDRDETAAKLCHFPVVPQDSARASWN